jgi:hypothetical protein
MKNHKIRIYLPAFCMLLLTMPAFSKNCNVYTQILPTEIRVSASSSLSEFPVGAIVDGRGMQGEMHTSDNLGKNMWISKISTQKTRANEYTHEGIVWLLVEFENQARNVDCIKIWNHNQKQHTKRGLKKVYIEYSSDGKTWQLLKNEGFEYHIIDQAKGKALEPADFSLETNGIKVKYLCITADFDHGNYYHDGNKYTLREATDMNQNIDYYGLSEIRLYQKENKRIDYLNSVREMNIIALPGYLKTENGPSREYTIKLDSPLYCGGVVSMKMDGKRWEEIIKPNPMGIDLIEGKFPSGYMEESKELTFELHSLQGNLKKIAQIPGARKWTLYFLPHSHQDIGYTHRQDDVMKLQWRNLERAIDLMERTIDYPEGSRFKWNSEATWSVKGYLDHYQGTEKAKKLIKTIQNGNLGIDAALGSILTGICKQEELMHIFDDAHQISQQTGVEFNTAMMSDVPGQSWGYVTALAQNGIKYYSSGPNYVPFWGKAGSSRVGLFHVAWADIPFYWQSAGGTEKVLCWQTGKGYSWFHGWILDRLSSCGIDPIWEYLSELETKAYPYATSYLRYTIHGDNGPPDEQMPDIIKEWNEKYEFPQFRIGTTKELFTAFEKEYGDYLPVYQGDMTPVWEDGAASTARELTMNRASSERLNQSEILWSMISPKTFPAKDFTAAWRNVVLFSEHTWGASNSITEPESQFVKDQWNGKKIFAENAGNQSKLLYEKAFESLYNGNGHYIHVFNTNLWKRTDVVRLEKAIDLTNKILESPSGELIPVQKLNTGQWIFLAKDIPALSSSVYRIVDDKKRKASVESIIHGNIMDNGIIRLEIDKTTGTIVSFSKNGENFNYVAENGLNDYIYTGQMLKDLHKVEHIKRIITLDEGDVAATIRIESEAPGCRYLWRDITIYKGFERIDITNTLDKLNVYDKENVRFAFPFNIPNAEITLDMAMCEIHPEREQLTGSNKNFYTILNGLEIHNNLNQGIYFTTIDAPFVEIGEMSADSWRVNSRGLGWKTTATISPVIYSWVMNNTWGTNYKASQDSLASFNYSIELSDSCNIQLKRQGIEQTQKLIGISSNSADPVTNLFRLKGNSPIAISTIKPSDDGTGYIIRLQNMRNNSTHSSIEWGSIKIKKAYRCDNRQQVGNDFDYSSFWLKPFECITVKIIEETVLNN